MYEFYQSVFPHYNEAMFSGNVPTRCPSYWRINDQQCQEWHWNRGSAITYGKSPCYRVSEASVRLDKTHTFYIFDDYMELVEDNGVDCHKWKTTTHDMTDIVKNLRGDIDGCVIGQLVCEKAEEIVGKQ